MKKERLVELGFKPVGHYNIMDSHIYNLGRFRHLSVGCIDSPNEMLYICETSESDSKNITDLVCLHNWDFDGELLEEKIVSLIKLLK